MTLQELLDNLDRLWPGMASTATAIATILNAVVKGELK